MSNELIMMPYKNLTAWPQKVTGAKEPYPRASAYYELLTKVTHCLPRFLGAVWSSVAPAQTPIHLGGQELSSPRLQMRKRRL